MYDPPLFELIVDSLCSIHLTGSVYDPPLSKLILLKS